MKIFENFFVKFFCEDLKCIELSPRPRNGDEAALVADDACVETTLELLRGDVVRNFVFMGYTEHVAIRELDVEAVR